MDSMAYLLHHGGPAEGNLYFFFDLCSDFEAALLLPHFLDGVYLLQF